MGINTLEELAPWIAIAFTLALSILVPLFTQIANNRFQLKMQRIKDEQEKFNCIFNERRRIYSDFLYNVGAGIAFATKENLDVAGASIQKMYLVCPREWWEDLDGLYTLIRKAEWGSAELKLKELNKLVAKEYSLSVNKYEVNVGQKRKKEKND